MPQKVKSFIRFLFDGKTSKKFLVRYASGQALVYSGLGKGIVFATPHFKLRLTKSPVTMVLFGDPENERTEEAWLDTVLCEGDTVVDIGANVGTFSLKSAKLVGEKGKVFAFEALPKTAEILRANIILNNAERHLMPVNVALGDRNSTVHFSNETYDDINHVVSESEQGVVVPLKKLDDIVELTSIRHIKLIKIDVEGYELPVLNGGEQTISRADMVLFEAFEPNCTRFNYTLADLFGWFTSRNYTLVDPDTRILIDQTTTGKSGVKNVLAVRTQHQR